MNTTATSGAEPMWRSRWMQFTALSAFLTALMFFGDTYMAAHVMYTESWAGTLAYFIIGAWVGFIVVYGWSVTVGNKMNTEVKTRQKKLDFGTRQFQWYAIQSGFFIAISTFSYIYVLRGGDTVLVVALSSTVAFFTLYLDKSIRPPVGQTLLAIATVTVGIALVVATGRLGWGSFSSITLETIIVMLIGSCFTSALSRRAERLASIEYGEGNLLFWRFFWLVVTATIGVALATYIFGVYEEFVAILGTKIWEVVLWSIPIATVAYFANYLRVKAQNIRDLTRTAIAHLALQILLTMLLTFVLATLIGGELFAIPVDPVVWVQRIAGSILIIVAVAIVIREPTRNPIK